MLPMSHIDVWVRMCRLSKPCPSAQPTVAIASSLERARVPAAGASTGATTTKSSAAHHAYELVDGAVSRSKSIEVKVR